MAVSRNRRSAFYYHDSSKRRGKQFLAVGFGSDVIKAFFAYSLHIRILVIDHRALRCGSTPNILVISEPRGSISVLAGSATTRT